MRIVGFNSQKVSAERKKIIRGKVNIKTDVQIENIEKENLDIAGEVLNVSYKFSILYEPDFAELIFKGSVLVVVDNLKNILKDWKKKNLSQEIRIPIINFIISKCSLKALQLEDDLALPLHIPFPKLASENRANYTG